MSTIHPVDPGATYTPESDLAGTVLMMRRCMTNHEKYRRRYAVGLWWATADWCRRDLRAMGVSLACWRAMRLK